jgi:hypothetical protein
MTLYGLMFELSQNEELLRRTLADQVCVCVCERERERERARASVRVRVRAHEICIQSTRI